ncbi:Gfo/Idh/MocA family oxidoreductase [Cellulomonas sp. P24]|uniref:Gfo/Idh/MocA family protein n=1 Tax=Cellulomonas sp. P24 TaxID=2885206 RepID=UPI00216B5C72|nr:Gfo/Idh/MocA family oxidoreductase [Cellulomonas sp. P24]MCR6491823.1 Gfo/Idh/MocA family oxidoreductase [Cellulomonas sp. P24]
MTETTSLGEDRPLRVGLIGYGLAGAAFHAPIIATTPGLDLATVVTSRADAAAEVVRRYPGTSVAPTVDELFATGGLDVVVVATTNDSHVPLARRAIEVGLAVVVDKPVAPTAREARDLAALAEDRGVPLTVFQNRRWDGDFLTLRTLLGSGAIGEVHRFESRFEFWRPVATGNWRESGDPAALGGVLYDLGAHLVDQAVELFGPVAEVRAETDVRRAGTGAEDDAFVALQHASGVRSHLWMSAVAADQGHRFRVLGSAGAYTSDGLDPQEDALVAGRAPGDGRPWGLAEPPRVGRLTRGETVEDIPLLPGDYPAFYAAVERAVRTGSEMPVRVADTAAVLDVLAAARTSAQTGTVQRIA